MAKPTHSMTGAASPHQYARSGAHEPDATDDVIVPGIILGGKYRLISEIGRGGMGSVWRAEHLGWEAPVALKVMNRDITARPEAVARFEREVRLAAGLRSPHVVQVLDHGLDEATSTPFIAMELLEGESLARRLRRIGLLAPAETFDVFSQLVRALSRAHAAGIVHRDLKPDNVFLVRNEEEQLAKVLDFGVAKWTAPDISESGLTRPGSVVGTPYYMSPEQIQGSRDTDHRADLWALAAIACECLTGRRPFEAPDFAQLAVMLLGNQGRPLPSELGPVPRGFDAWFLRATDPDINRRFQTAREMVQTLAPICDVAPSSLNGDYPSAHPLTSTRQDAPSMAAVSNTAARLSLSQSSLSQSLWQRPMGRLIGTTVVSTLVVTGAVVFWFVRRPALDTATDRREETSLSLTPAAPAAAPTATAPAPAPPGIRPIREQASDGVPRTEPSTLDFARPERAQAGRVEAVSPRSSDDEFARDETERNVRAKLLDRPRHRATKPKRNKLASAGGTKAPSTGPGTDGESTAASVAPSPRGTKPAAPAAAPSDSAPSVVDGRRIRTSL
ncbi:MAG TPA: serine/threonine-protein kinase [Polyangiaceae bacterium]|nr:serine/threonine-protein kinase [Polyangiaceae bacterium]